MVTKEELKEAYISCQNCSHYGPWAVNHGEEEPPDKAYCLDKMPLVVTKGQFCKQFNPAKRFVTKYKWVR